MRALVAVLVLAALAALAGCGVEGEPHVVQRESRRFRVAYADGSADTVLASNFYLRGWNNSAVEFMDGWNSVAYISRQCTVSEIR